MAEQKPCVRCNRPIDAYARSCVYCSWDQSAPPLLETTVEPPLYVPPSDHRFRYRIIATIAFAVLVITAFVLGSLVRASDEAKTQAALRATAATQEETPRATVTLVPVEGGAATLPETPVTTAPSPHPLSTSNADLSGDRADATALPSEAYAIAAREVKAERAATASNGPVDPRTIAGDVTQRSRRTGPDSQPQPPAVPAAESQTKPVPLSQPVPSMSVDSPTTARLTFTVDSDGHVQDINVVQSIPGEMPRLIAAVQNWRYKPATLNGQPVTSTLSVDINVHPR